MEGSRDLENVEKELKPIRYQSETYSKVTSVINRVNVASLWDAHEHQKRGKAVGIDGVDKETYEEGLVEKLWDEGTKNGPDRSAVLGHNFVYQETKPHGF